MTTPEEDRDFGYWHRAASENLHQATQEAKLGKLELALRFLHDAKRLESVAASQASDASEELLALELAHTCEILIVHLRSRL